MKKWKELSLEMKILWCGIFFHLLAVIFSEGFQRPDEHLGIMRFVAMKLQMITPEQGQVSWEYPAMIRPWLQPFFHYLILRPFQFLGLNDPFVMSFMLRLVSSIFGLVGTWSFYLYFKNDFQKKESFLFVLLSLWFIPFFHARPTAENWCASAFIIALPWVLSNKKSLLAGFFLALSFIFRYQMIVPIGALALWMIVFKKISLKNFFLISIGFLITNAVSTIIDYWGYGTWTFAPWNYWYHNIVEKRAASFGVEPWWYYLEKIITRGIPPFSLFIFFGTLLFWWKEKKHVLTWISLSFLVVHSLIGHKEVRFLFPMSALACYFAYWLFEKYSAKLRPWIMKGLVTVNILLLLWASLRPAHDPIKFYKHLYYERPDIKEMTTLNLVRDQLHFYQRHDIKMTYSQSIPDQLSEWILSDQNSHRETLLARGCSVDFSSYPEWVMNLKIKSIYKSKSWSLYHCGEKLNAN